MVIGSRDGQRAAETARQLRERVEGKTQIEGAENATAAARGDVVVLTVPFSGHAALLKQLKPAWKPGTIGIDTTVPLAAEGGDAPTRMLGVWQGSAAEQARELLPPSVSAPAAFQNLGPPRLASDEPCGGE